jgi:hypothetical protein
MSLTGAYRALAVVTGLALVISLHSCAFTTDLSGTLAGKVRESGTIFPISGAVVECEGVIAVSQADGSYSMEGIPPGDRVVFASAGGYANYSQVVGIQEGTYHDIHMNVYIGPATLSGYVTHSVLGPLEGARVTIGDIETYTDALGYYEFDEDANLQQISYYMTVSKDGYRSYARNVTPDGIGYQLDVALLKLAQVTLWSEADATIMESHPNMNFGLEPDLYLFNNELFHERFFILFMTDQIEATAVPSSAVLRLYNVWATGEEEPRVVLVGAAIEPWLEEEVTWNDSASTTGESSVPSSYEAPWYEVDLTEHFYDWLVQEEENYGLLIDSSVSVASRFVFASREHAAEAERPHVVLDYAW